MQHQTANQALTQLTDGFVLSNQLPISCIGFGTWQLKDGEECTTSTYQALQAGYRHIDTATVYKNEVSVGNAIQQSGVPRDQIFLTTKVWNSKRGYENTLKAFDDSIQRLGVEYVDLYLIHWPAVEKQFANWKELNASTWKALEELYRTGKAKAIGVCNFKTHHMEALLERAEIKPMVNQIEFHPGFMQEEIVALCKAHNILVEGWSPLGMGAILDNPTLKEIASRHQKSVAQVCINWALTHYVLPLPRTTNASRVVENADVFDFVLSKEDIETIDQMPITGWSGMDPDLVDF